MSKSFKKQSMAQGIKNQLLTGGLFLVVAGVVLALFVNQALGWLIMVVGVLLLLISFSSSVKQK